MYKFQCLQYLTAFVTIVALYCESIQEYVDELKNKCCSIESLLMKNFTNSFFVQGYSTLKNVLYKLFYKIPYDLGMTYAGVVESYIDEYKLENNNKLPEWYWFPYFYVASVWYIMYSTKTVFNNKMKEIYRDKQLIQCVENHNNEYLKVNYEWHDIQYCVNVKIDKFVMRDLVRATTAIQKSQTENVTTFEYQDCSNLIRQYLGPSEDWHRIQYTPQSFGFTNLQLYKLDTDTYQVIECNFNANDVLPPMKQIKSKIE
jgi:hypothetical protein